MDRGDVSWAERLADLPPKRNDGRGHGATDRGCGTHPGDGRVRRARRAGARPRGRRCGGRRRPPGDLAGRRRRGDPRPAARARGARRGRARCRARCRAQPRPGRRDEVPLPHARRRARRERRAVSELRVGGESHCSTRSRSRGRSGRSAGPLLSSPRSRGSASSTHSASTPRRTSPLPTSSAASIGASRRGRRRADGLRRRGVRDDRVTRHGVPAARRARGREPARVATILRGACGRRDCSRTARS